VAFAAPVGKIEGPVHGTFGWYVVKVTKTNPGSQQSLSKASVTIKQLLKSNAQTAAGTAVNNEAKKNWGDKTICRSAYSMADCKGYTPPKTTSSPTPTPSPSNTSTSGATTTTPTTTTSGH
jgi:hypothetical protein